MKVTLSSSSSLNYRIITHSPAFGKEVIDYGSAKFGVFEKTIMVTSELDCSGNKSPDNSPEGCMIFSKEMSGGCTISKKSTSITGGSSAMPYVRESITYVGVQ